jgi:hypothetical protein
VTESHNDETGVSAALADMLATGRTFRAPVMPSEIRMQARWSSLPRVDGKLVGAFAAVVLLVAVVVVAGPLHTKNPSPSAVDQGNAPAGWIPHSVYRLQVSVPKDWSVQPFASGECPDGQKAGTLFIGTPRFIANCPNYGSDTTVVSITAQPIAGMAGSEAGPTAEAHDAAAAFFADAAMAAKGKTIVIHGLRVKQSLHPLIWSIPSRAVLMTGSGPRALRIMGTLTAATSHAIPAPGMVSGSAYLVGGPSGPLAITASLAITRVAPAPRGANGNVTKGALLDGHYSETLPPGKYHIAISPSTASCPGLTDTVVSGQTVMAPAISCQGD